MMRKMTKKASRDRILSGGTNTSYILLLFVMIMVVAVLNYCPIANSFVVDVRQRQPPNIFQTATRPTSSSLLQLSASPASYANDTAATIDVVSSDQVVVDIDINTVSNEDYSLREYDLGQYNDEVDEDDEDQTIWNGYYGEEQQSSLSAAEDDLMFIDYDDYDEESDDHQQDHGQEEEDGVVSYHTLTPSLDLLISWTLDYVDAVDLAGGITRVSVGVQDLLDADYVFCSPTIGPISKFDFVNLMSSYTQAGFDLASAIPDLTVTYDGWHVDPHNPWRIWAVARYSGTHTGSVTVPTSGLELIPPPMSNDNDGPKKFVSGPELQSFVWTPSKQLIWQTVGYVGDRYTGTNQGHGCGNLDGLLVSMGLPPLLLETTQPLRNLQGFISQFIPSGYENSMKVRSSYSNLPYWWHQRTSEENSDNNIHR
mmetsp:Transcript_61374/g.150214  ORF Transcript_61374/g.150214 Transcript_61374/m.150214 type:complete len:425 (+) Transcript_61374:34-1308(+)